MVEGRGASRVETVTVLFTDLVGSTEMRNRLGEEGADRLRYAHDALVAVAIESGGGTIIKSTGDGVMATFPGAADAVSAAVAVQQAIFDHNRRDEGARLAVRIGLSIGDVTIEPDGDCFGLPVVEAQRLEAAAAPDQILCSSLVRALARGRGDHQFSSVGELELKGLAEPLPADEVQWEPLGPLAEELVTRLPPLLLTGTAFGFAGRTREMAVLTDAWKASLEGPGSLVLLAGEPGIGKTRLVSELAVKVLDQGGLVLAGRSDEDLNVPYGPIIGALTWWAEQAARPLELGEWPAELTNLVPELSAGAARNGDSPGGDTDAALVIRALRSWLEVTSRAAPTMLVLDDLHWADSATLLVLRSLFDREPTDGLLVVGTYRDTDLDRRHPLAATLADLRRHEHVSRLSVSGLDQDGVVEFLSSAAGYEIDESGRALADAVWEETAGNPFFVGEILRHLAETGAIVEREGTWTTDLDPSDFGIPEGIREVVGRRLTRLGEDTERVLSAAAVVGLDFDIAIVTDAVDADADDVIDALEHAERAALVDEVTAERWRFSHAIVRETLLDELSSARRVRQHRKIATAIEARSAADLDAVANQLAYHWGEAAAGGTDLPKALEWGIRAGDLAFAKAAVEDAIRWYDHSLGLLDPDDPSPADQCSLLVRSARAKALVGDDHRDLMFRAAALAHTLCDSEQLTAALVITPHAGYSQDASAASPELLEQLEHALTVVGPDQPSLRAQLLAALALELQFIGEGDRRAALCTESHELALVSGDETARFASLVAYFYSYPYRLFDARLTDEMLEGQIALLGPLIASGDGYRIAIALHMHWYCAMGVSRTDLIRAVEALEHELLERRPTRLLQQTAANRAVMRSLIRGDLEAAAVHLQALETIEGTGSNPVLRFCAALEGGYVASAIPLVEEAVATAPQRRFVEGMLAIALVEAGDLERANAIFEASMIEGVETLPDDTLTFATIGLLVEVGILLRRVDRIDDLVRWTAVFGGYPQIFTGVMYLGAVGRLRGTLAYLQGDGAEAERCFRAAIEAEDAIGAKPMLAATRLDWADMLLESGDRDGARALVQAALDDIGALPLVRQRRRAEATRERLKGE